MTLITAVMLTVDQREKTLRCLRSWRGVEGPEFEILLWDNGSTDGTVDAVRAAFPSVHVHRHSTNLGAAAGRNAASDLAIETFSPRLLLFLDNDMVVTPGFLDALARPFETGDPTLAQTTSKVLHIGDEERIYEAGGCRINYALGRIRLRGSNELDRGQYEEPIRCLPSSGSMMIRTDVFLEIGGFDPAFDPYGLEDIDLSTRVSEAGYHGKYIPSSVVFHERGHTFESGYTPTYAATKARNWLIFLRKHATWYQRLGFYVIGAPLQLTKVCLRAIRNRNLGAIRGLVRGGLRTLLSRDGP